MSATAPTPSPPPLDDLTRELLRALRTVPLLKDLDEEQQLRVARESDLRRARAGEAVCREGEYGTVFWVILSGIVKALKRGADGRDAFLATIGQGGYFGEMGCMSGQPRSATIVAESDTLLLEVPEETFFHLRDKVPSFKQQIDDAYRIRALSTHLTIAPIFKGLPRTALQAVVDIAAFATVPKDRTIVVEGQASDAFYLVRHGFLRVTRRRGDRDEIVAYLRDNTYFGELSLTGGGAELTTVTTMSDVEIVVITRALFEVVAAREPALLERRSLLAEAHVEKLKQMTAIPESGKMEVMIRRGLVQAKDALVIHTDRCTKCEMCVQSCSAVHGGHALIQLTGIRVGDLLLPASCYNCRTPDCMLACRFGCITRDDAGLIYINEDTCTGCTLCSRKCPYGTIFMVDRDDEIAEKGFFARVFAALLKRPPAEAAGPPAAEPAPPLAPPGKPGKNPPDEPKGTKKAKRLAVKCDQCMGHGFTACVYNCPTGAIERVSAQQLYDLI